MRDRTRKARIAKLLKEESAQPQKWWWLSFADETGFLGAVVTRAHGITTAIMKTHSLGINPGGEVAGFELADEMMDTPEGRKHTQFADQLLSKKDIDEKLGAAAKMPDSL